MKTHSLEPMKLQLISEESELLATWDLEEVDCFDGEVYKVYDLDNDISEMLVEEISREYRIAKQQGKT